MVAGECIKGERLTQNSPRIVGNLEHIEVPLQQSILAGSPMYGNESVIETALFIPHGEGKMVAVYGQPGIFHLHFP